MEFKKPMSERLPTERFAECGLDDPKPFEKWEPSPEQIARWSREIREANEVARLDESGPPGAIDEPARLCIADFFVTTGFENQ